MITPDMNDEEKRAMLLRMSAEDLEAAIARGSLTWQEFDRLMPEIGGETAATIMFERDRPSDPQPDAVSPAAASADDQPLSLDRLVAQMLAEQEKTNALLADILHELRRRP